MFWLILIPGEFMLPSIMVDSMYEGSLNVYSKLTIVILLRDTLTFSKYTPGYTITVSPDEEAVTAV
jgi:hypothetical protein